MNNSMHLFSNLGHVVILAPLSLILIFYLISIGARRDAIAFAAALIVCLTITVFAKLFFEACGARNAFSAIESPSGTQASAPSSMACSRSWSRREGRRRNASR